MRLLQCAVDGASAAVVPRWRHGGCTSSSHPPRRRRAGVHRSCRRLPRPHSEPATGCGTPSGPSGRPVENVREVAEVAGASAGAVLGKVGEAFTVAAVDSAGAGGSARPGGGTSSKCLVNPHACRVTPRRIRTTAPGVPHWPFMEVIRSPMPRSCAVCVHTDRLEITVYGSHRHNVGRSDAGQQGPQQMRCICHRLC